MIRLSVMYKREPGKRFDIDYYINHHIAMVHEKLDPLGVLVKTEIDKGMSTDEVGESPYVAIGHLYFNSFEDFQKGFADGAEEFIADEPNFTDIEPLAQFSEVVK